MPASEIDPIYFERTYYLGAADKTGEPVYALLVEAMEKAGLAAIATYVFHERENLGCLRVRDGVLTLEKMFFHDEVRPSEGIAPEGVKVDKKQLEMAIELIKNYTGSFDPTQYEDNYRARLLDVIEQKRDGKEVKRVVEAETTAAPDLLAALQASLVPEPRGARKTPAEKPGSRRQPAAAGGPEALGEVAEAADPPLDRLHRERPGSSSSSSSSQRSGVDTGAPGFGRTE